ncbi:MAG TPA: hypothetical protein VIK75_03420 [Calditerricola sp.]
MKWGLVAGLTAVVVALILYEWPKIDAGLKKERQAFLILTALGWLLGVALIVKPDLPSPSALIDWVFRPWVKMIVGAKGF